MSFLEFLVEPVSNATFFGAVVGVVLGRIVGAWGASRE